MLGAYEMRKNLCRNNLYKMKIGGMRNSNEQVVIKMIDQYVPRDKADSIMSDIELKYIKIQN